MKKQILLSCILTLGSCFSLKAQAPTSWQSRGIGGGGALFSPSINPANHNEMYVACDMSELFHSTNAGQNWGEENFTQVQGGHDSYVSFTNNPSIRYVVDYTSVNGMDMTRPMKSTNGGATWTAIAADPYASFPGGGMERLIADYNNPNNLILADYGTIYFSNNGGTSFTQIHTNINGGAGNHLAGVFFDGANIYIGTNDGLIYSTNSGAAFNTLAASFGTGTEQMLSFSGAREGATVRFVCLTADAANVYADIQYGSSYYQTLVGVYTMDNANGTWASKMGGINTTNDFPVFCGMANNDIDTMYLAGGSNSGSPIVMKATFSTNWAHIFNTVNNQNIATGSCGQGGPHGWSWAEAPFGFQVCPNSSKIVMMGDYGFAHSTTDAGTSWHQQYVAVADQNAMGVNTPASKYYHGIGLENTTNWQVMWTSALNMYAPFSDISGVMSQDSGKSWNFIPNLTVQNSVYRMTKDNSTGNIYAATATVHDMYQSTRIYDLSINGGTGNVYFSTNNGVSFSVLHNFGKVVMWVALDPSNSNRMYAAVAHGSTNTGGIWVTNNLSAGAGSTWSKLAKPPRSNGHAFNITVLNNGDLVASFSARKPTSGSNFTDSSGVYYYDNTLSTWSDRSDVKMHYWTKDVVVDPNDATQSTWYAAVFSGWANVPAGTGGLYKTTNKGVSWTQISNSYRVNSATINPSNANELYFTTETDGLWYCSNASNVTPTFSQVASYPFRGPVRVFFNPYKNTEIWVSSFGNGMFVGSTVQSAGINSQLAVVSKSISVFPNPASEAINFGSNNLFESGKLTVYDISGKQISKIDFVNATALDVSAFSTGMYFYQVNGGDKTFTGKFVVNR